MRVLVLSSYFPPDISATGDQTWIACRRLVERGDDVSVVCTFPHYATRSLDPAYRRRLWEREERDGMQILRVPLYAGAWRGKLDRALNYATVTAAMAAGAAVQRRPEVLLVNSPPPTLGLVGAALARLWRVPWVYHAGDVWTVAIETLARELPGPLRRGVGAIERAVFESADAVTTVSEELARTVVSLGVPAAKVTAVPSAADTRHITPRPRDNPVSRRLGLVDTFNLLFSGNIGLSQGLEHVVSAVASLRDELPALRLLIVGSGATRPAIERQVADSGLDSVLVHDFLPKKELPDLLATADVGLVPLSPGIAIHSTPSKIYTLMAAARPILAAVEAESETARTVRAAGAGLVVPPANPAAFAAAVRSLYADRVGRADMGAAGRRYVEAHFTDAIMGDRFREVLVGTLARSARPRS